ncbi:unnamed protein product [Schistosoma curassoni]|uniref:ANK_REP_REGION domain-containing protein n=1 Tax=Schistosoma curassoni TaxID=6186 RepID=A0A183K996_9TREM|nr:unnamed protein product [Schistosoma curassoni]
MSKFRQFSVESKCYNNNNNLYLRDKLYLFECISPEDIEEARSAPEMKMLSDLKAARLKRYNLNILDAQGAAPSGVDPNSLDADGWTPSHVAACWGEVSYLF